MDSNTGNNTVAIGYQAGKDNTANNQFIVQQANINAVPLIQGDFSTGYVGIGTTTPQNTLNVVGDGNFTGNLTIGSKLTFKLSETIDNLIDGWLRITGNLNVTGNTNIEGDLNVSGFSFINNINGEMWYHNHTATELNFAVDGLFYNLTTDNSLVTGMTFNDTGDYLEVDYAGRYKSCYMQSGDGQNNHNYFASLSVNGEVIEKCESHKKMSAGGDILTMNGCCNLDLIIDDKIRMVVADIGNTGIGNYYSSELNMHRISN